MIVVFVVDTTASMNQKWCGTHTHQRHTLMTNFAFSANGLTLLDCAKSAVEHVTKMRARDPSSRNDRYLLVTSDEQVMVRAVRLFRVSVQRKVGWKDANGGPGVLLELVKSIEACGLGSINTW